MLVALREKKKKKKKREKKKGDIEVSTGVR